MDVNNMEICANHLGGRNNKCFAGRSWSISQVDLTVGWGRHDGVIKKRSSEYIRKTRTKDSTKHEINGTRAGKD